MLSKGGITPLKWAREVLEALEILVEPGWLGLLRDIGKNINISIICTLFLLFYYLNFENFQYYNALPFLEYWRSKKKRIWHFLKKYFKFSTKFTLVRFINSLTRPSTSNWTKFMEYHWVYLVLFSLLLIIKNICVSKCPTKNCLVNLSNI